MASLDDTIISRQNLMLLDNVTNYRKPALDYFHHQFNSDALEMPMTWTLLLKMRKHKLLRLPSCAIENDADYNTYLMRLHHCLWRRWSMEHFKLEKLKIDPLSINWNKETDITVLYGPDLTGVMDEEPETSEDTCSVKGTQVERQCSTDSEEEELIGGGARAYTYSSSVDSHASSIFDDNTCMKMHSNSSTKSLKFSNTVLRRDIDRHGAFQETHIQINDAPEMPRHLRRHRKSHRRHRSRSRRHHDDETYGNGIFADEFISHSAPLNDDELLLEMNICNLRDQELYI
ncbi:hypothetical protein HG536_0H02620 [Torulaspora globosa]|uniref:Nitrogen regulatory protein areA GATA-like domain-containing protein n=1 Tax=Torulaspora globosa TaxID=48254 RepID=A0A7G3ZN01_9SACH|nr:uncharacterized protein HG536_0H02620 [Torulaspora globosa]QLL34887.1 hypothetical protein HG536_0H02620 [Torulaspora globosa]